MSQEVLGGFEHRVLLTVMRLGGEAYTVPVVEELEALTGRAAAPAAVYTTLRRLEDRGLLSSRMQKPEAGGRTRRVFRLEPAAIGLLRHAKREFEGLWSGLSALERR